MASPGNHQYPDHLNPFGSDDEAETYGRQQQQQQRGAATKSINNPDDEYPDYLSPFGDEDNGGQDCNAVSVDNYDNSLNPFGDEDETNQETDPSRAASTAAAEKYSNHEAAIDDLGEGNPFAEDEDNLDANRPELNNRQNSLESTNCSITHTHTPQPESLEPPPIPLPRTKSLLKKEQAQKNRQQQLQSAAVPNQADSLLSNTSSTSMSSINVTTTGNSTASTTTNTTTNTNSFQRKKNKRNAPPVPINFKRQVSGSLDAIEEELNEMGDKLAIIEQESSICQENLKATHQVNEAEFAKNRSIFVELIKRKNSIVRRQKELMYRKRELKLDQIHSDIEYELRMIGNKQLSHKTAEDETREKELLKKLVEIVEEKSDIVENLNKDTSCDSQDVVEALRRLNLVTIDNTTEPGVKTNVQHPTSTPTKNENCDKSSITMGNKLSKIATLLPKSATLKGTMKIKRKRLFKKSDSRPVKP